LDEVVKVTRVDSSLGFSDALQQQPVALATAHTGINEFQASLYYSTATVCHLPYVTITEHVQAEIRNDVSSEQSGTPPGIAGNVWGGASACPAPFALICLSAVYYRYSRFPSSLTPMYLVVHIRHCLPPSSITNPIKNIVLGLPRPFFPSSF